VNSYEWSILQEMMAYWIGVPVGTVTYFASSFHLYRRHYETAKKITAHFDGVTCCDFDIQSPALQTSWSGLDRALGARGFFRGRLYTFQDLSPFRIPACER
jgi:hypothetical protein